MDATIWPRISSIWPSGAFFDHGPEKLHEEDDVREVVVEDARRLAVPPVLDTHGFELLDAPTQYASFETEAELDAYAEETAKLVQAATGADIVVPFHEVKMDTGRDKFGKRGGAVERVHGDYTHTSGPLMLDELRENGVVPPESAGMRGAILNVWRNASAVEVQSKPLAVCDVRSVNDPDDFGTYNLVEGGEPDRRRTGQNLSLHYSPRHKWHYFPHMRREEALVFFTYDGRQPEQPRFTFHAAFDPVDTPPDALPRQSVIVRLAAFFDGPAP